MINRTSVRRSRVILPFLAALLALASVVVVSAEDDPKVVLAELALIPENNVVGVFGETDGAYTADGNVEIIAIEGDTVTPGNLAWAQSTCVGCRTIAVAFQLALYEPGATNVSPENLAVALNINCTDCETFARAYQIIIPVDDAEEAADDLEDDAWDLNRKLDKVLARAQYMTFAEAIAEVERLVTKFERLQNEIDDDDDDHGDGYRDSRHDEEDD